MGPVCLRRAADAPASRPARGSTERHPLLRKQGSDISTTTTTTTTTNDTTTTTNNNDNAIDIDIDLDINITYMFIIMNNGVMLCRSIWAREPAQPVPV